MGAVQKFKLLALNCATAAATTSPSHPRLPSTSQNSSDTSAPCLNLRRGITLKRFLSRRRFLGLRHPSADPSDDLSSLKEGLLTSHKLRDLFICSPPHLAPADVGERVSGFEPLTGRVEEYPVRRRRFGSFGLRHRILRGAWRPRLGAIPE